MERKGFIGKIKWLTEPLNDYCIECLSLIKAMFAVRIVESIALLATDYDAMISVNNLIGFAVDVAYIGWIIAAFFIIHLIISRFSQKAANITTRIIFAAYLCTSMLLAGYFASTHIPLDSIITAYSPRELFVTIKANSPYNIPIVIAIVIAAITFAAIPREKISMPAWAKITMMVIFIGCAFFPGLDKEKFRYDKEYYIIESKTVYLYNSLRNGESIIEFTDSELKEMSEEFASYFPEYQFIDYHYPFLHKDNTADVLSPYFEKSDTKPNIAIIIVEGLCKYISGKNSTVTSATPFLDSLSEHALVWENCLSTSERTFGVLPSVLGALPFGEKGFLSYRRDAPNCNTLASILHDNGYKNTFFYGGWYGFDSMDIFAENNSMETYYDKPEFENVEARTQWGLCDEYLLIHSLDNVKESADTPRLDVYLTLSTHDPFDYPDRERLTSIYDAKQCGQPDKLKVKKYISSYASFLYTDNCLRKFLEKYKECESYSNTIFIITGDHKFIPSNDMYIVPGSENPIENFRVPLIIWSPMLKSAQSFQALATHRDITPTLLAYIKNNHGACIPENESWLNAGLDTSKNFESHAFSPHYNAGRNCSGLTYKLNYITDDGIFLFDTTENKLTIKPTTNDIKLSKLPQLYKKLENYIMNNNALMKR